MKVYLLIIFTAVIVLLGVDSLFAPAFLNISIWNSLEALLWCAIFVAVCDIFSSIVVRVVPQKWYNPTKKIFKIFSWEKAFYESLNIREWKEKIPEFGKCSNFKKDKVYDKFNNKYVEKFLREEIIAEVLHMLSGILGVGCIFIFPLKYAVFYGLPIFILNFMLNLIPVWVQRYNRPKVMKLYEHNLKREQEQKEKETTVEASEEDNAEEKIEENVDVEKPKITIKL